MYVFSESTRSARLRFAYRGPCLGWAAEMTVSFITRVGVYFISLSLSFRAVVSSDSPAFAALDGIGHFRSFKSRQGLSDALDFLLPQLQSIFRSRAVSPYDVDVEGNTILHVSLSNVWQVKAVDTFQRACIKVMSRGCVEIFSRFCRELQGLGIPHNMINALGRYLKSLQLFFTAMIR